MKICIASDVAPRRIDSYERYHFGIAALLVSQGWQVTSLFSGPFAEHVRRRFDVGVGVVHENLGGPHDRGTRGNWLDRIRREQPNLIWTHFFPIYSPFSRHLRRIAPQAVICQSDRVSRGPIQRGFFRSLWHRRRSGRPDQGFDLHIAVSRFVAHRLIHSDHVPSDRVSVIYNGVDLQNFHPSPRAGKTLLAVAYLRPEKGIDVLLHALGILKLQGMELPCQIVGDGPCLAKYQRIASQLGISHVEFLGLRDDVELLLSDAMLAIVPSIWPEAFSFFAAEAQACGVPVIASNVGGLPEVVADQVSGLLVPPDDPEALAQAIATLAVDPARRSAMGQAGRQRAERLFGLDRMIRESVEILQLAAAQPRHASRQRSLVERTS